MAAMKAKLTLDEAAIGQAVIAHVQRQGWEVHGTPRLIVQRGCGDQRDYTPDTIAIEVDVQPQPTRPGSAYDRESQGK